MPVIWFLFSSACIVIFMHFSPLSISKPKTKILHKYSNRKKKIEYHFRMLHERSRIKCLYNTTPHHIQTHTQYWMWRRPQKPTELNATNQTALVLLLLVPAGIAYTSNLPTAAKRSRLCSTILHPISIIIEEMRNSSVNWIYVCASH